MELFWKVGKEMGPGTNVHSKGPTPGMDPLVEENDCTSRRQPEA